MWIEYLHEGFLVEIQGHGWQVVAYALLVHLPLRHLPRLRRTSQEITFRINPIKASQDADVKVIINFDSLVDERLLYNANQGMLYFTEDVQVHELMENKIRF